MFVVCVCVRERERERQTEYQILKCLCARMCVSVCTSVRGCVIASFSLRGESSFWQEMFLSMFGVPAPNCRPSDYNRDKCGSTEGRIASFSNLF